MVLWSEELAPQYASLMGRTEKNNAMVHLATVGVLMSWEKK